MKKLEKLNLSKFENKTIDLSKVKGGTGTTGVTTPGGTLNGQCYSSDYETENGTTYYPCKSN